MQKDLRNQSGRLGRHISTFATRRLRHEVFAQACSVLASAGEIAPAFMAMVIFASASIRAAPLSICGEERQINFTVHREKLMVKTVISGNRVISI